MDTETWGDTARVLVFHTDASASVTEYVHGLRDRVHAALQDTGAVLFRGLSAMSDSEFSECANLIIETSYSDYGDLPAHDDGLGLYKATPYPPDALIRFHNEGSHTGVWPRIQMFLMRQAAAVGGEWGLADGRSVASSLDEGCLAGFQRAGLRYVRRFWPGLDVDWRDFLCVTEPDKVGAAAAMIGLKAEWEPDQVLMLTGKARAAHTLDTGVSCWWNQIQLHHPRYLDPAVRSSLERACGHGRLPRDVLYGDGSAIPDDILAQVDDALEQNAQWIDGREGDLLIVNNELIAHARAPYQGRREVLVALGDPQDARSSITGGPTRRESRR